MIRIILLLLLAFNLQAQNPFSVEPNPTYGEGTVSSNFFNANAELINHTDSILIIQWERTVQDIPLGWESAICLNFTCLASDVDSGEITLYPSSNYPLDLIQTFYPNEIPGTGRVELKIWIKNDTSFIIHPEYFGTVEPTSIVNSNIKKQYSISPNPTQNSFSLDKNLEYSTLEIFNMQGQFIQTFSRRPEYHIEYFPTNLYFVHVLSKQKELLAVIKLTKL